MKHERFPLAAAVLVGSTVGLLVADGRFHFSDRAMGFAVCLLAVAGVGAPLVAPFVPVHRRGVPPRGRRGRARDGSGPGKRPVVLIPVPRPGRAAGQRPVRRRPKADRPQRPG